MCLQANSLLWHRNESFLSFASRVSHLQPKLLCFPSRWCFLASRFVIIHCLPLVTCLARFSLHSNVFDSKSTQTLWREAGVRSVEKVDSRGPSSWGVCHRYASALILDHWEPFQRALSPLPPPLWCCFPNEPEQWSMSIRGLHMIRPASALCNVVIHPSPSSIPHQMRLLTFMQH